ncbi:MAG: response regulator [Candidatus Eisenbacteria bacterium]|nr:response regulator [Candidatus Eisenbacteria bacterium]
MDKPRQGTEPPRILLVDDEEINRQITARILEIAGYRVDQAEDGLLAVEAAGRERYDLILMDCRLPGMDGWTAARKIREREDPELRVPIIAVTAGTGGDDYARASDAGMDGVLHKPFEPDELRAEVKGRLLGSSASGGETGASAPAPADPERERVSRRSARHSDTDTPVAVSRLIEISGGDAEFMQTLIGIFLNDTERHIANLENALRDQNSRTILYEAHAIKGSSGHAGAEAMHSIAGSIESMGEEGRSESIPGAMQDLKAEFRRVRSFLEQVRGE